MSKPRKSPASPGGAPLVRRTLAIASLGLAACGGRGSKAQPPQVVPPAPPPMVPYEALEETPPVDKSDAGASNPVDPEQPTKSSPPMIPDRPVNPPPMVPDAPSPKKS